MMSFEGPPGIASLESETEPDIWNIQPALEGQRIARNDPEMMRIIVFSQFAAQDTENKLGHDYAFSHEGRRAAPANALLYNIAFNRAHEFRDRDDAITLVDFVEKKLDEKVS